MWKKKNTSLSRFGGASPDRPKGETAPAFDYYIHVQVQGFGTLKFHGSRYFKYTLCVCMLLK